MEIRRRVARMYAAYNKLVPSIFGLKDVPLKIKLEIFNAAVLSNGLYGSEIWNVTKKQLTNLESAQFQLLKRLMSTRYENTWRLSYVDLLERAAIKGCIVLPMEARVRMNMLRYGGHIIRRRQFLQKKAERCLEMALRGLRRLQGSPRQHFPR